MRISIVFYAFAVAMASGNFIADIYYEAPPVEVALYYESFCPGCKAFVSGQLWDTYNMHKQVHAGKYQNVPQYEHIVIKTFLQI